MKQEWISALEKLRFDIVRREPVQGHKEHGAQTIEVFVNNAGEIRLVVTRRTNECKREKKKSRAGREFQVFREQSAVTIVNYKLRDDDNLGLIVSEMENEIAQ